LHINVDKDLVRAVDEHAGAGQRSAFFAAAVRHWLDQERRWRSLEAAMGSVADVGHDWDDDPASWVASQRRADPDRSG